MRSVVDTRIERLTDKGNQSLEEFLEELFLTVTYMVSNGMWRAIVINIQGQPGAATDDWNTALQKRSSSAITTLRFLTARIPFSAHTFFSSHSPVTIFSSHALGR